MEWWQILILVAAIVAGALIVLYILGKRAQKKADSQQEQIDASKQQVTMLIIDKKKMKIKDSGLPKIVYDKMPKLLRGRKFPVVKAKVGPRIMTFLTDSKVFEVIPVKKEIKATVAGLYITDVKGMRGALELSKKKKKELKKKESKFDQLLRKGRGEI
jgi:hypothetical protein